jgi:iojap-like ribosome-associated protein
MSPKKLRDKVIESLEELKAVDQVCLDVSSLTTLTDFMIIVTGTSSRHIQSLADRVVEDLKNLNIRPLGLEGEGSQEWVLVDYGDVIVHLMSSQARTFYDLESLWDEDL